MLHEHLLQYLRISRNLTDCYSTLSGPSIITIRYYQQRLFLLEIFLCKLAPPSIDKYAEQELAIKKALSSSRTNQSLLINSYYLWDLHKGFLLYILSMTIPSISIHKLQQTLLPLISWKWHDWKCIHNIKLNVKFRMWDWKQSTYRTLNQAMWLVVHVLLFQN